MNAFFTSGCATVGKRGGSIRDSPNGAPQCVAIYYLADRLDRRMYQTLCAICYPPGISCSFIGAGTARNAHDSAKAAERDFVRLLKVGL